MASVKPTPKVLYFKPSILKKVNYYFFFVNPTLSFSVIFLINLHGFPAATTPAGISFVTILPDPITVSSLIVTPLNIVVPPSIRTL